MSQNVIAASTNAARKAYMEKTEKNAKTPLEKKTNVAIAALIEKRQEALEKKRIPVRLILPGGGIKAVFQAGFIREMLNTNMFEIDKVYGCSAGAIIAPLAVTHRVDDFFDVIKDVKSIEDIVEPWPYMPSNMKNNIFTYSFNKLHQILGPNSLFRRMASILYLFFNLGLYKRITLIDNIMQRLTPEEVKLVEEKVEVVAYDVLNHKSHWFSGKEIDVGIRASSALWLVVPPVKYKNNYYSDGGGIELYPVENVDPKFKGLHLVVDLNPEIRQPLTKLPRDVITLIYELFSNTLTKLAEERLHDASKKLKNKLIIVRPDEMLFQNVLDFNQKAIMQTFDAGRIKFHQFLLEHLEKITRLAS